ncbi:hypothetical protein [uncultured Dokdonia sp.]|uniref:hypothetical protein n=1 Tax=uncultured Dokdonia sp. TaxID=575653 RepID=UPI002629F8DE|nr:hypothetical protein [uncultured Dokdonia sp.]
MKLIIYITIILSLCSIHKGYALSNTMILTEPSIEDHIAQLYSELENTKAQYQEKYTLISLALSKANHGIKESITTDQKLYWLLEKDRLKEERERLVLSELSDLSKIRYIKGLQIIKILYEKTLALDHHFASVSTFHEINKIANPNNYPEFKNIKEVIGSKADKRKGFDLTKILGNNIYTSVAHSFISLFNNDSTSRAQKEESLKDVECILDFTLRMHNDLNTIYFETVFLQKSNENIIGELQQLFVDFTKPIKYKTPLKECRDSDDWDSVRNHLDTYLEALNTALADDSKRYKAHKMQINLEFPIDRLLQFITQYNAFIDQGAKFYEKFGIMLDSYENETQCASKIPVEYKKLKESITVAIEKFNTAYRPVEINGSKMKEVLYGLNEYD